MLTPVKVKDLKRGEWFVLHSDLEYPNENQVYVRGDYCREIKKYSVCKYGDICSERFFIGNKIVYKGFSF